MTRTRALSLFLGLALFPACDDGDDGGSEGEACWADNPDAGEGDEAASIQKTWGAPCTADADCVALLGDDAICETAAVIYGLPGGYCTKICDLTGDETLIVDDPTCDPAGGVNCIGADAIFERCAVPCTGNDQCGRDGYQCRQMPQISGPDDPSYCLMDDCCEGACGLESM